MKRMVLDVAMPQVGRALAEGRMDATITSAATGVENKVWGGLKHYHGLNAWFPKNIVFVNAKAFAAPPPATQQAVLASAAVAKATGDLRKNGIKVDPIPFELGRDLKRLGERFSREWVASVGNAANEVFIPFYTWC